MEIKSKKESMSSVELGFRTHSPRRAHSSPRPRIASPVDLLVITPFAAVIVQISPSSGARVGVDHGRARISLPLAHRVEHAALLDVAHRPGAPLAAAFMQCAAEVCVPHSVVHCALNPGDVLFSLYIPGSTRQNFPPLSRFRCASCSFKQSCRTHRLPTFLNPGLQPSGTCWRFLLGGGGVEVVTTGGVVTTGVAGGGSTVKGGGCVVSAPPTGGGGVRGGGGGGGHQVGSSS
eukprot:CAMPEP_0179001626 /NCGR_PEP_ID=MMETSP0795-20121207/11484_1 /TAXON_ID=88552 /ORGANISM="Amoebophrya sp., Strain Ameob2" /LENGTH=232 /DNA_ID=CAMNT_0020695059 /DNA_START=335 /DNA_END=1031 /DNA_ORIENTATION=+